MFFKRKKILGKINTPYNKIIITQKGTEITLWAPSGIRQTVIDTARPCLPGLEYAQNSVIALAFCPCAVSMLILGLGGGALPVMFYHISGELHIDVVEIDPMVPILAEKYFNFFTDHRLKVYVEDASHFIRKTGAEKRYDIIIMDAYIGHRQHNVLTTTRFFLEAGERLKPGGVFIANLLTRKRSRFETIQKRIGSVFRSLWVLPGETSTNTLLFAKKEELSKFDIMKNALVLSAYKRIPREISVQKLLHRLEEVIPPQPANSSDTASSVET
jgi:spermidine synthase